MVKYEEIVQKLGHTCLRVQALEARPYVEQFCGIYKTELVNILPTQENEKFEPMYVFTDNMGGYTLDGLIKSIEQQG